MRFKTVLWTLLALILLSCVALAKVNSSSHGSFGLGIIIGEPTGLSGKLWISKTSAFDGVAAWALSENSSFHLHFDYLLHNFNLINVQKGQLPVYYGIGARILFHEHGWHDHDWEEHHNDNDVHFGLRIPVGLEYIFADAPLDIFIEVAPVLDLVPDTHLNFNGGIGIRYFF
jgi:hypothetical protein